MTQRSMIKVRSKSAIKCQRNASRWKTFTVIRYDIQNAWTLLMLYTRENTENIVNWIKLKNSNNWFVLSSHLNACMLRLHFLGRRPMYVCLLKILWKNCSIVFMWLQIVLYHAMVKIEMQHLEQWCSKPIYFEWDRSKAWAMCGISICIQLCLHFQSPFRTTDRKSV